MLRITRKTQRLLLEGRLTAATVPQLEAECRPDPASGDAIALDLSGLRFADEAGAVALARLRAAGVLLEGGSGFVRELLQEVSS